MNHTAWLFKSALRDTRRSRGKLFLFTLAIVMGIMALVAINTFRANLYADIESEAKELLGADLVITTNQPPTPPVQAMLDSLGDQNSREANFASMVSFPKAQNGTRLVQVRALGKGFPYYGAIGTEPENARAKLNTGAYALADQTLMLQFGIKVGDSVRVGNKLFQIIAAVNKVPGQAGIVATVAPPIYIPLEHLEETGLVQFGSRIVYKYYYQYNAGKNVDQIAVSQQSRWEKVGLNYETVASRKDRVGNAFEYLTQFLNLVGFVALLLGCIGLAGSVHIHIKDKLQTVALLRCLGASGADAFKIYLIQVAGMGLVGAFFGAILGSVLQIALPTIMARFLPISIGTNISWITIVQGLALGLVISVLFGLLPLLSIRKTTPLRILRPSEEEGNSSVKDPLRWLVIACIGIFIYLFAWMQLEGWQSSLYFTLGLGGAFLVLGVTGWVLSKMVRRFFPVSWSFAWRQGLANLFRPNNQTLLLTIALGLGTTLIATLYFIQNLLLNQINISAEGNQPNLVIFDIQRPQREAVQAYTKSQGVEIIDNVPIVTMRMAELKGKRVDLIKKDPKNKIPNHIFDREYRVSYREKLTDSEEIIEGKWEGSWDGKGIPVVSLESTVALQMNAQIGDLVTFNVQGTMMQVQIGSIRKVDFRRIQPTFTYLFPKGVLEQAPQFYVLVTHTNSQEGSAKFQHGLIQQFPNLSIVDLQLILKTAQEVLDQVSFAIQFMAFFSIATGFLVLLSSIFLSKYQRLKEYVLLRTLGSPRSMIIRITAVEYGMIGAISAGTGLVLALIAGNLIARYAFKSAFVPQPLPALIIFFSIVFTSVIIGILLNRDLFNRPPLEVLRTEVEK